VTPVLAWLRTGKEIVLTWCGTLVSLGFSVAQRQVSHYLGSIGFWLLKVAKAITKK